MGGITIDQIARELAEVTGEDYLEVAEKQPDGTFLSSKYAPGTMANQNSDAVDITGGSISGANITEKFVSVTDPVLNGITQEQVDGNNGILITLTAAGNSQALPSPTEVTIKKVTVINNDTSSDPITVEGITLDPGKGQTFIWDGTTWGPTTLGITEIPVPQSQGGTGSSTGNVVFSSYSGLEFLEGPNGFGISGGTENEKQLVVDESKALTDKVDKDQTVQQLITGNAFRYSENAPQAKHPREIPDRTTVEAIAAGLGVNLYLRKADNDPAITDPDAGPNYKTITLDPAEQDGIEGYTERTGIADTVEYVVQGWITNSLPKLLKGRYAIYSEIEKISGRDIRLFARFYKRNMDTGVETQIGADSSLSEVVTLDGVREVEFLSLILNADEPLADNEKFVGKIWAIGAGGGSNATVRVYYSGTVNSFFAFPLNRSVMDKTYAPLSHVDSTDGHPLASPSQDGFMSKEYAAKVDTSLSTIKINHCGYPGQAGFPNGICPEASLPPGMLPLAGYTDPTSPNYGNYIYSDGSIMVYRPQSFIKIGDGTNGLGVNEVDVVPWDTFATEAEANDAGYFIHEIFKNGGVLKKGIFRDKYHNSKNAKGTGFIASSIKNGLPISTHADHNPIADLTACSANAYYETINAAKARDGIDGAVNPSSIFFTVPRQLMAYIALTSLAHGQASTSATYCAWYDATGVKNFPKGCNNNALGDTDDGTVAYVSDGYSNCGKAGSGTPFAKTTDNGQECGIADVNGLMWLVNIGFTCIASAVGIIGVSHTNPCQITAPGHNKATGDWAMLLSVGGTTQLNDKLYKITVVDPNTFTLDGVDATGFTAYTSGGTATFGKFYTKTAAARYEDFTSGNSGATDHWGAAGVAAMMEEVTPEFLAGGGFALRYGSTTNQVLSSAVSGNDFKLLQVAMPVLGGVSTSGTNLFGLDYFYQYIRNELCAFSGGVWSGGSGAGVWDLHLNHYRSVSSTYVGCSCACYPV